MEGHTDSLKKTDGWISTVSSVFIVHIKQGAAIANRFTFRLQQQCQTSGDRANIIIVRIEK